MMLNGKSKTLAQLVIHSSLPSNGYTENTHYLHGLISAGVIGISVAVVLLVLIAVAVAAALLVKRRQKRTLPTPKKASGLNNQAFAQERPKVPHQENTQVLHVYTTIGLHGCT